MAKSTSTIPSAALAKALGAAARASGKDPFQMVHIQAENGRLAVRCFNGLMGILATIPAQDKGNSFEATIDAQAFASLVGTMNGAVTLAPSGRNGLQVQCGSVDVTLKGIHKALPVFEDPDARKVLSIHGQELLDLMRVGSCAASDVTLAYASVLLDITSSGTASWATDSFRAATCAKPAGGEETKLLLPLTLVNWARAISARAAVTVKASEKRVTIEADDGGSVIQITSPVNDVRSFPALSRIFDAMFEAGGTRFTLDAGTLSRAARQARTLGADTVALQTDNNNLCLCAKSQAASYNNVLGTLAGQVAIFLDPQFLGDGMGLFTDTPEIFFIDAKKPLCAKEGDLRILFMPKNPPLEQTIDEDTPLEAAPAAVPVPLPAGVASARI
jgi:hypothetical protein